MPEETLDNLKKFNFFGWLFALFYRRNPAVIKFHYPRVSPGYKPLAKAPEDYDYEIALRME